MKEKIKNIFWFLAGFLLMMLGHLILVMASYNGLTVGIFWGIAISAVILSWIHWRIKTGFWSGYFEF